MPLAQNKYQVAYGDNVSELQLMVTKLMEHGFVPTGGIHTVISSDNGTPCISFYQAMWEPPPQLHVMQDPRRYGELPGMGPNTAVMGHGGDGDNPNMKPPR